MSTVSLNKTFPSFQNMCLHHELQLVLIRMEDIIFNRMFSDPYCRYTGPTGGSGFAHIGGHDFQ